VRARESGRRIVLVEGPKHVQDLFRLTGMQDQFDWVAAPA
jgi:hypothetical protein